VPPLALLVTKTGRRTVVRFPDTDLDTPQARTVDEQLHTLARRLGLGGELRLDLEGVAHLGSTALSRLLALNRQLEATGKALVLDNLDPAVYELLHLTRLTTVLESRPQAASSAGVTPASGSAAWPAGKAP
jgi:anti-anti-sigma factor